MWLMQALQVEYELTLLTGASVDWLRLNTAYGTSVDPARMSVHTAPIPCGLRSIAAGDALRGAFFQRFCREIGQDFDLCISAYNFIDFDRPSVQFVADFSWDDAIRREFDPVSPGLRGIVQRKNPLRSAYLAATDLIRGGGLDLRVHKDDVIIANSNWSADLLMDRYDLKSVVIYPPVHSRLPGDAASRSNDFVMLGRISPDKRIIEAIDVLNQVRARGHHFQFHIIGPLDHSAYSNQVRKHAEKNGHWVRLRGGLYGEDKFEELRRHGFGLHMRRREAFGIAVAEMIKSGLVPFVPAASAPAEIIASECLVFEDVDHAVEVIDRVLSRPDRLASIRRNLAVRAELFSADRFVQVVRELVGAELSRRRSRRGLS